MTAQAKRQYLARKSAGLYWLDLVPTHWSIQRLKFSISGCYNGIWGSEPDGGGDDIACVRVADFDRVRFIVKDSIPTMRSVTRAERRRRDLRRGDLLLEKSGGGDLQPVGTVALFDHDVPAVCSNFVARMPVEPSCNPRFLSYLHANLYAGRINERSIKQTTGIQNLDADSYLSEYVPMPPLSEQRAIAAFLDRETARIDALIEKKRRLIELLRKKRAAAITKAVTQGLGNDVELGARLRPSGQQVPKHWKVLPLRRLLESVTSGSRDWARYYADEGRLFLRIANLTRESIDLDLKDRVHVDPPGDAEGRRTAVRPGDILFSITAFLGSVAVVPNNVNDAFVNQHIALCRMRAGAASSRWIAYCFLSAVGKAQLEAASYGGTKSQLGLDDIKNLVLPVPPDAEQAAIVAHLDRLSNGIERGCGTIEAAITRLSEYRASLISATVTGQIDVREAA